MSRWSAFSLLSFAFALLAPLVSLAQTPPPRPADTRSPAELVLKAQSGSLLVGTTADGRLVSWDLSDPKTPKRLSEQALPGQPLDVRIAGGVVFVVIGTQEVHAFMPGPGGALVPYRVAHAAPTGATPVPRPEATPEPTPVQPAPAKAARATLGTVKTDRHGSVLVELHEEGDVKPGDHLLVRSQVKEMRQNLFTGQEEQVATNAPIAIVEIVQVQGKQAVAQLARGESVSAGDTVERTTRERTGTQLFAPRTNYTRWARATLRPMLNWGKVSVASLSHLEYGHYFGQLHLQARLAPIGVSVPQTVDALNAHAIASYATDAAEFGVGAGYFRHAFQARDSYQCERNGYAAVGASTLGKDASGSPNAYDCTQAGFSVVQHLRLGSVDGLHLRMTNTLAISGGKFRFGYLEGSVDLPVSRTINLYGAGGGSTGVGWGEAGIRTFLRGVGGKETFILTTGIGGSSIASKELFGGEVRTYSDTATYVTNEEKTVAGLHIAVGLEYRF